MSLPEDAIVGGWVAAVLHGVRDAEPDMPGAPSDLAVCYRPRHDRRRPPGFRPLRSDVLASETELVGGIRVTSPARTAYDMARFSLDLTEAVAVLDLFAWAGNPRPVRPADLHALADARPGSRGNPRVRAAAELMSSRSRSVAESRLRARWVRECGVDPAAVLVNATLRAGGTAYELDLVDLSSGLVGEYDGTTHAEAAQRSRDYRKDAAVDSVGLTMQRYTSPELRLDAAPFARLVGARRDHAIRAGAADAARALAAHGDLREETMRIYEG